MAVLDEQGEQSHETQQELQWQIKVNENLTVQNAALRKCCEELRDIIQQQLLRHNETVLGRTHDILNIEIPKILRATK